jgi:hypothetical protein
MPMPVPVVVNLLVKLLRRPNDELGIGFEGMDVAGVGA